MNAKLKMRSVGKFLENAFADSRSSGIAQSVISRVEALFRDVASQMCRPLMNYLASVSSYEECMCEVLCYIYLFLERLLPPSHGGSAV